MLERKPGNPTKATVTWGVGDKQTLTCGSSWLTITSPGRPTPLVRLRGEDEMIAFGDSLAIFTEKLQRGQTYTRAIHASCQEYSLSYDGFRSYFNVEGATPWTSIPVGEDVLGDLTCWLRHCRGREQTTYFLPDCRPTASGKIGLYNDRSDDAELLADLEISDILTLAGVLSHGAGQKRNSEGSFERIYRELPTGQVSLELTNQRSDSSLAILADRDREVWSKRITNCSLAIWAEKLREAVDKNRQNGNCR